MSFYSVVSLIQRDTAVCHEELVAAFSADLLVLMTSDNGSALQRGAMALDKTAFGKKVKACLITAQVPQKGYQGGITGPFKNQPVEVQEPFLTAHTECVARFQAALTDAGLFTKKEQSEEAKATAKAKREKKAADATDAEIKARGLVDPSTLPQLTIGNQIDNLILALTLGSVDPLAVFDLAQACADSLHNETIGRAVVKAKKAFEATAAAPVGETAPV